MKNLYKALAVSAVTSLLLIGCGSSDSDTTTTTTGYFIDAPVAGVAYTTTSGLRGVTDELGRFQYQVGDSVKLQLGNLILGETTPGVNGLVTPENLVTDTNKTVLMLQLLQALDSDNNTSNGITIAPEIVTSLEQLSETEFEVIDANDLLNIDTLKQEIDEDGDNIIDVDETEAQAHFEESKREWEQEHAHQDTTTPTQFDISLYPVSVLTQEVKDTLAYMENEERLAYDVYTELYNYHLQNGDEIRQLTNIANNSEVKHIDIVDSLIERYALSATDYTNVDSNDTNPEDLPSGVYDVQAIQDLYDTLVAKGKNSTRDALEVGCMVEVVDVNDLDHDIVLAQESNASDVVAAFEVLRSGSYSHYWAFDKGLKNMGVADGCCSLGSEYCKTTDEYPQVSHGRQ